MYQTTEHKDHGVNNKITVNTKRLAEYLDCGRATAVKIGAAAGARVQIGKRVLWNIELIQKYINSTSSRINR